MLPFGVHNTARLLEDPLLGELLVEPLQGRGDPVVLPEEDGVESGQTRLLVDSLISRHLTVVGPRLTGSSTGVDIVIVPELLTGRQEGATNPPRGEPVVRQQEDAVPVPHSLGLAVGAAVDVAGVEEVGPDIIMK